MKSFIVFVAASLFIAMASVACAGDLPAPVQALQKEGFSVLGHFDAPDGLTGYAARYHGRPFAIYVPAGAKYAIVGTMIDAAGKNLTKTPLKRLVRSSEKYQKVWSHLADMHWILDGSRKAPRTVYMFTDMNCPYCNLFWHRARPWVKAGKVQIRHILLGLIKPSSLPKATAVLAADNPSKAMYNAELHFRQGGIKPQDNPPAKLKKIVQENTRYLRSLGFNSTPVFFFRNEKGRVTVIRGVPHEEGMIAVMGSPRPAPDAKHK